MGGREGGGGGRKEGAEGGREGEREGGEEKRGMKGGKGGGGTVVQCSYLKYIIPQVSCNLSDCQDAHPDLSISLSQYCWNLGATTRDLSS